MASKYQMWLTHNAGRDKLRFPVLPDEYSLKNRGTSKSVSISGLGEVVIKQDRPALEIAFKCFFPATPFPGVQFSNLSSPRSIKQKIESWKNSDKPVQFLITGTDINLYCIIEDFRTKEEGGDVDSIHYSLVLKEYREVKVRQVKVNAAAQTATLPASTPARTDNRVQQSTHTVIKGDTLWDIAAAHLGSGSQYPKIYALNTDIIKNPNLIYPGQTLRLP